MRLIEITSIPPLNISIVFSEDRPTKALPNSTEEGRKTNPPSSLKRSAVTLKFCTGESGSLETISMIASSKFPGICEAFACSAKSTV